MRTPALALLSALAALPALADEVELASGSVVEGKVEDLGDSIRVSRGGGAVTYPKSMVRKITPKKSPDEVYEERAKSLKDGDLAGRVELARWAAKQKLAPQALAEWRKVIALDPDHEEARKAAGFEKVDGKWLGEAEANEARGLVRHKGRWVSPEQRDLDLALDEQKELDAALTQEVQKRLAQLRSSDEKKRAEALEALTKIEDKYKAKAYIAAIASPSRELRKHVYLELARMKVVEAARPLARRAMWDEDEALRPVAEGALRDCGNPHSALFLLPFLGEEGVGARIRAIAAIAPYKDLRTSPALAQALENNLAIQQMYDTMGREMSTVTMGNFPVPGGGVVSLPRVNRIKYDPLDKESRAKLATERGLLQNALRAILGEDHGTDVARWRACIEKKTAKE
jgi:hypothetical protein